MPREDAPETCAETIYLTCGGETGPAPRRRSSTPLLIHDLPVTVWWPGEPPFIERAVRASSSTVGRPAHRRRLDVVRRRAGPACADGRRCRAAPTVAVSRLRAAPPVPLAGGDRLDLRPPGVPAVPRPHPPDRGHYADPRRDAAPRSTNVVKPVYHVAWLASRLGLRVVQAAGAGAGQAAGRAAAPQGRPWPGMAATLVDGRAEVASSSDRSSRCRRDDAPGRAPGGVAAAPSCGPTSPPRQDAVHARVWLDGVDASWSGGFNAPRRNDVDLLAEAIEAGGRDRSPSGRCGWRPRSSAEAPRMTGEQRRDPCADPTACARAAARTDRRDPRRGGRGTRPRGPLGDDRRLDASGDLPPARRAAAPRRACPGSRSSSGGATSGSSRRPSAVERPGRDVRAARDRRDERKSGTGGSGVDAAGRSRARRSRRTTSTRSRWPGDRRGGPRLGRRALRGASSGPRARRRDGGRRST